MDLLQAVYRHLGKIKEQHFVLENIMRIAKVSHKKDAIVMTNVLRQLGNTYNALGDAATAKNYHERTLKIKKKLYGPEHIEVAMTLGNLGTVYSELGDELQLKTIMKKH